MVMGRGGFKYSILNHGFIMLSKGRRWVMSFKGFKKHLLGKIREIIGKGGIIQVLHRYLGKI